MTGNNKKNLNLTGYQKYDKRIKNLNIDNSAKGDLTCNLGE
jgi:hypothetical protein